MRNRLIKLLRRLEEVSGFQNKYPDSFGEPQCDYDVEEHINLPNYRLIRRLYDEEYLPPMRHGSTVIELTTPENGIMAELKRMERDDLIIIGTQQATKYAYTNNTNEPDYDEGFVATSESIVLTTKG